MCSGLFAALTKTPNTSDPHKPLLQRNVFFFKGIKEWGSSNGNIQYHERLWPPSQWCTVYRSVLAFSRQEEKKKGKQKEKIRKEKSALGVGYSKSGGCREAEICQFIYKKAIQLSSGAFFHSISQPHCVCLVIFSSAVNCLEWEILNSHSQGKSETLLSDYRSQSASHTTG